MKDISFKKKKIIPYITRNQGLIFGAIIEPSDDLEYKFHSVLHFPGVPSKLSGDLIQSPSGEYRSPTYSYTDIGAHTMWLDEGDPSGIYKLEFYINNQLTRVIEFEVVRQAEKAVDGTPIS